MFYTKLLHDQSNFFGSIKWKNNLDATDDVNWPEGVLQFSQGNQEW